MSEQTFKIHMATLGKGRKELREGGAPAANFPDRADLAPVPARVARLVALAHHVDGLVRAGKVRDYAQAAALAGITRARVSQIVNLLLLAPEIQAALLDMTRHPLGDEPLGEQDLRPIVQVLDWQEQRRLFARLR